MKRWSSSSSLPRQFLEHRAKITHSAGQVYVVLVLLASVFGISSFLAPEQGAEYAGEDVIEWGTNHLKDSAGACCAACQAAKQRGCNVWVYCGNIGGCGPCKHRECWLKRQREMRLANIAGNKGTNFTSGALFDDSERAAAIQAEHARVEALRLDEALPLVWIDVAIKGQRVGRIHFVLFVREAPRAAENFRQLITGEKGTVPEGREGAGKPYSFKGKPFYRIIDSFIDQAGAETESVFGGQFKDDPGGLKLTHDRKGLLSMANTGPDTNTSHFSIMLGPAPHLNGHYTIFGEVVDGLEVIDAINALAKGKKDNTATAEDGAVIVDCGQVRKGTHEPNLNQM
eukprot:gene10533-10693_t